MGVLLWAEPEAGLALEPAQAARERGTHMRCSKSDRLPDADCLLPGLRARMHRQRDTGLAPGAGGRAGQEH